MLFFYTFWKPQKVFGFLYLQGVKEEKTTKIGQKRY